MADNVAVTEGSGKTVAADDVGGVMFQRIKVAHGADGTATDTSLSAPFPVAGIAYSAPATFTPAAASHVANDVVGGAQEFDFNAISGSAIRIDSLTLMIATGTIETTTWRLYLYNVTPPSAIADDGAWDVASGDRASFLGFIDIPQVLDLGSTLWIELNNIGKQIKLSGDSVFGYLVNLTTLTPANVAHTITLHAIG